MVKISKLNKFFNKGRQNEIHVINDVNLELPDKGMVAIFGRSGCGKTTLLNVIGGLDSYAGGALSIDNENIKNNTDEIRNKYIGYIFQNYNLNKNISCFDNVADALRLCGMRDSIQIYERVMAALSNVGMPQYAKRLPDTLSGGQQQRIAIARAIVKNPKIILADEPTGNLDEANTVMIMDLLKAISRDHLVLLVTHEANLVDYYCDKVIELSDGKVVSVRENESAGGYVARDKNDIYLGELKKTELCDRNTEIEYYGDAPSSPVKITVVNNAGRLYIKIGSEKVQILDDFSEVKLKEGVFEARAESEEKNSRIDMSKLPPVEGSEYGKLFTLGSALKSGYKINFRQGKKKKKMLRGCMALFAVVIVFMTAVFGTAIADIRDVRGSYNKNTFYISVSDEAFSKQLIAEIAKGDSGIDHITLNTMYYKGDYDVFFSPGTFETFETNGYSSNYHTNAVYLDTSLLSGIKVIEGKTQGLTPYEIVISNQVADALLEKSSFGYINDYSDLIGMVAEIYTGEGNYIVAGIADTDEPAVYFTELTLAKYAYMQTSGILLEPASEHNIKVAAGEAVLVTNMDNKNLPKEGDKVKIRGDEFKLTNKMVTGITEDFEYINYVYVVNDNDYIALSKQIGESHPSLAGMNIAYDGEKAETFSSAQPLSAVSVTDADIYYEDYEKGATAVLHSFDTKKTESWFRGAFPDYDTLITPDAIFNEKMIGIAVSIIASLIAMLIMLVLMSICMYFIMRSSLMGRIKEIGIYRAIGVSKKNLAFKFLIEAFVLATLTVIVGFVLTSAFLYVCIGLSPMMTQIFYYPIWLALCVLAVLYAISLFFGVLPVVMLLRKTPSRILSQYDI